MADYSSTRSDTVAEDETRSLIAGARSKARTFTIVEENRSARSMM